MLNSYKQTIESVVRDDLCAGCGTCVGICPRDAIEMVIDHGQGIYLPHLDKERCNQCGICFESCPGHIIDFKQLNQEIFGKEPDDIVWGNFLHCYMGHATDYDIRFNSASGGLVTTLLIFALEQGIIDGALVSRMREDRPLEPQPFIARTSEEIISAAKSKYCPVPANIALKEILKEEGRYAVVGLPCHIQGIRKAERINRKLKERIVVHFGLLCQHTDRFTETEFILKMNNIKKEQVLRLEYRGHGWPGAMTIYLKDGTIKSVSHFDYMTLHGLRLFSPWHCMMCPDLSSELADITFMDSWLPDVLAQEKVGKSIIITRTELGETICQGAKSNKVIEVERIACSKADQAQGGLMLHAKNREVILILSKVFRHPVPDYNTNRVRPALINYLLALGIYFNAVVSSKVYLGWLFAPLAHIEPWVFHVIRRLYRKNN